MSTNQPANYPPPDAPHWDPPPPGANFPPPPNQYRPQIQYNHQPYPPPPYQYNQPPLTNHHRPNPPAFTAAFWQADGRKRKFNHYPNRRPPLASCESFAKLYVSQVPRTSTEEDIHSVFGQHGKILEVILMKDKRTGQQQGTCFVKFATVGDAEVAIGALHNQYTYPGETESLKVKFADGEQERLGLGMHGVKLYIKNFSRHASKKEIEELFSKYGEVEDVHILLDDLRHSRGMGFIKFSDIYMAEAAIYALNGTYIMKDCEYPLIVRFADAKKPQNDLRFNLPQTQGITGGQAFVRNVQQGPAINYGAPVQANPTNLLPQAFPPVAYKQLQPTAASLLHCGFHPLQQSPTLMLAPAATCYTDKTLQEPYQSHSQIADMHPKDNELSPQLTEADQVTPHQKSEDQLISQQQNEDLTSVQQQGEFQSVLPQQNTDHCLPEQASGSSSKLQEVDIVTSVEAIEPTADDASLTSSSLDAISSLDCDWSEHFCPDGNKYYYNCETSETRWEKPVEYASFEKHVLKLIQNETSYSTSQSLSSQEVLSSSH